MKATELFLSLSPYYKAEFRMMNKLQYEAFESFLMHEDGTPETLWRYFKLFNLHYTGDDIASRKPRYYRNNGQPIIYSTERQRVYDLINGRRNFKKS